MKEKVDKDKEKEENIEEDEKKNFFQTFISYFKYNNKLHKKLNNSLLFNAYIIVNIHFWHIFENWSNIDEF